MGLSKGEKKNVDVAHFYCIGFARRFSGCYTTIITGYFNLYPFLKILIVNFNLENEEDLYVS